VHPDGHDVVISLDRLDMSANRYRSALWTVDPGDGSRRRLTNGPRDTSPSYQPQGRWLAFLRLDDRERPQLALLPRQGGESVTVTSHPLGVSRFCWSPDGSRIAYEARSPEPGRYGTDDEIDDAHEPARLIEHLSYLADGVGYVLDRPTKIFVIEVDPETVVPPLQSRQLSQGPGDDTCPVWLGTRVAFLAARNDQGVWQPDRLARDVCSVDLQGNDFRRHTDGRALIDLLVADPGAQALYYRGIDLGDSGEDFVASTPRWYRWADGQALTDPQEYQAALAVATADGLVTVSDVRGRSEVTRRRADGTQDCLLATRFTVTGLASAAGLVAVTGASATSFGELLILGGESTEHRVDFGDELSERWAVVVGAERTATSADGYPVHGWLLTPDGPGPFPLILMIHGGPFAQYTGSAFDEAQVLVGAGYAVAMCNPRGGCGYGAEHGRAVAHAIGTVDSQDLLAFVDDVAADPRIDSTRVAVMGGSYGGLMTTMLLGRTGRFVAGITERSLSSWDSFSGTSDIGPWFTRGYVGDDLTGASPLHYADGIDAPLFVIHSERDYRCPLEQAQRLFARLKQRGVPTRLLVFPGEGHELSRSGQPRHRVQRFEQILAWWAEHLPTPTNHR
jgi:dipeptidyl aminopeptidase/acylaminoacyl peptidase